MKLPMSSTLARILALTLLNAGSASSAVPVIVSEKADSADFPLVFGGKAAPIFVDAADWPGVLRAAADLQNDIERVTNAKPDLATDRAPAGPSVVIAGTLGRSPLIDGLVKSGRLEATGVAGKWESFVLQTVANPLPGVDRALVIAGSDQRGTIYGLYELSEQSGVSPWFWWADVPVKKSDALFVKSGRWLQGSPGVKYRGIFLNDEDWGLHPWAAKTFDPELGNIGPKTYAKIYELMLRLRLNYIWPAMHECTTEFGNVPGNAALAAEYGIVAGSSHCEPMLCNNINWNEQTQGPWNYSLNRDAIRSYWEENVKARGGYEAVWTIGIRGIHDLGMQTPPDDLPGKLDLMTKVFHDQRELLDANVAPEWKPAPQCFVPYKEVLPIYDGGLKVPDDVTLVWVDDNFGYIRRLSSPEEQKRPGGAGVYWHLSYYGGPHSHLWLNTMSPALMWEELHKAWENDARTIWVLNVGDIKPMEIGIDYFSRLAWNPEGFPLASQRRYLADFAARNFGQSTAAATAGLLMDFYRLGAVRKPELMERRWALSLTPERAAQLQADYQRLLDQEQTLAKATPAAARDAYTEMVGLPARVLGISGLIFLADRAIQEGRDVSANEKKIADLRRELDAEVTHYNEGIAGGKWRHMMPGAVTAENLSAWNSQVRWPWGESSRPGGSRPATANLPEKNWRDAASATRRTAAGKANWQLVEGLGTSGRAIALLPAESNSSWKETDRSAPTLEYAFESKAGLAEVWLQFLPTFRLHPGMRQRVAVSVDGGAETIVEVPGSSGAENENGQIRSQAVQDNYVRARAAVSATTGGKHTLRVRAIDPGVVLDRIHLP